MGDPLGPQKMAVAKLLRRHAQKIRFGIVGVANTVLDFVLLFTFVILGVNQYLANYLSTGLAIVFSFVMNRRFTFRSEGGLVRQIIPFVLVTLTGLWVLQPALIWLVSASLTPLTLEPYVVLFVAKAVATLGSLTWNYLLYSRVVFRVSAARSRTTDPDSEH